MSDQRLEPTRWTLLTENRTCRRAAQAPTVRQQSKQEEETKCPIRV